jgi:arsenate reductase
MFKKLFGKRVKEAPLPEAPLIPKPSRRPADAPKIRVLFLCFGNSCRSPMAEGLANKYGSDVMIVGSCGLAPIHRIDPLSIKVMQDRNIDISNAFPKGPDVVNAQSFDLIVNMSGQRLPSLNAPIEEWKIPDPIGQDEEAFRKTADLLEQQVMRLVLQLRLNRHPVLRK